MSGVDLVEDDDGVAEVPVLRRQIDRCVRRDGALVDTLTGADEGKEDEPVYPAEVLWA